MNETLAPSIGLVASPDSTGRATLDALMTAFQDARDTGWQGVLRPVGETAAMIRAVCGDLGEDMLRPFPAVDEGGLVRLVGGLVTDDPAKRVDQVVLLTGPDDPFGLVPEVAALKRQCVVQRKPYLPNIETARHWWRLETGRGARYWRPEDRTVALVAHDALKAQMLEFADRHRDLLMRFKARYATGTTGTLLNGHMPERLSPEEREALAPLVETIAARGEGAWVNPLRSGPKGGDVEIANMILDHTCDIVVFFEDPFVSREHDADIQLLERVVRLPGVRGVCFHDPQTADIWADRLNDHLAAVDR